MPRGDIDMTAEPARVEAIPATPEPKTCASDDRERVIESLAQLLSSGRPLSEVLDEAKRLADGNLSEAIATSDAELASAGAIDPEPCARTENPGHNPAIAARVEQDQ